MSAWLSEVAIVVFFVANFVYALAYIVRDMMTLRLLTVIAAALTFPYFFFQPEVLWSALFWQSTFIVINLLNIAQLLYKRRKVKFGVEQGLVRNLVFQHFHATDVKMLFDIAHWKDGTTGECLVARNNKLEQLYLLTEGEVEIALEESVLVRRLPGSFIGELGFMTGKPTSADVVFSQNSRYICWEKESLNQLLAKNGELNKGFESLLAIDVASKLRMQV